MSKLFLHIQLLLSLPSGYRSIVLGYYLRKILGAALSTTQLNAIHVFGHLLELNGRLIYWTDHQAALDFSVAGLGKVVLRHPPSSDWKVFHQVYGLQQYKSVIDAYRQHFGDTASLIVDAGANVGLATLAFKAGFPKAVVKCIEPDPENFEQLQEVIHRNGWKDVKPMKVGLWDHDGYLNLDRSFRDGNDWSVSVVDGTKDDHDLKARSMPSLMNEWQVNEIDVLKLDIEGAESEVLNPNANVEFLDRVKLLAVEIHDEKDCRERIVALLHKYGFELFESGELTVGVRKETTP